VGQVSGVPESVDPLSVVVVSPVQARVSRSRVMDVSRGVGVRYPAAIGTQRRS